MRASDQDKLEAGIGAVNQWSGVAASAGVVLTQVNFRFPDGSPVVFIRDEEAGDWLIDT